MSSERHKKQGCLLFALTRTLLVLAIIAGLSYVLFFGGGGRRIYRAFFHHLREVPILRTLAHQTSLKMINDKKELVDYVNRSVREGKDRISFQTEDIDEDFISNINSRIEAFYGSCNNYTSTDFGSVREVTFSCTLSNAYYVERFLLEGGEIPEDLTTARKLARRCKKILKVLDLDGLTEYRKEKRIHDFIIGHSVYTLDGDRDILAAAEGPLLYGKGICSGYSRAMKLLCDLSDIECRTIVGSGNGIDHEWNLVCIEDHWYHVDVTWDDPTPDQDYPMYAYLNLDDKAAAIDHVWEKEYYPEADSTAYDYYVLNEAFCKDYKTFQTYMSDQCASGPETVRVMVGDYSEKKYSAPNLDFLFYGGARKYSFSICGPPGRTEYYFVFTYY